MEGSAGGVVRVGLSGVPDEVVAAMVQASCLAQGVPVKIVDPTVVRRVAVLLGAVPVGARGRKRSGPGAPPDRAPQWRQTMCTRAGSSLVDPGVPGPIRT